MVKSLFALIFATVAASAHAGSILPDWDFQLSNPMVGEVSSVLDDQRPAAKSARWLAVKCVHGGGQHFTVVDGGEYAVSCAKDGVHAPVFLGEDGFKSLHVSRFSTR